MRRLGLAASAAFVLALTACGSTSSPDDAALPGGVVLNLDSATCGDFAAADQGSQLVTTKQSLEFFRKTLQRPGVDPNGEPTNEQVRQLSDATAGYCGDDQASERLLDAQARFVDLDPKEYLGA